MTTSSRRSIVSIAQNSVGHDVSVHRYFKKRTQVYRQARVLNGTNPARKDHVRTRKKANSNYVLFSCACALLLLAYDCESFRASLVPQKTSSMSKSKKWASGSDIMDSYIVAIADEETSDTLEATIKSLSDENSLTVLEGVKNGGGANNVMSFVSRLIKEGSARDMIADFPEPPLELSSNVNSSNQSPSDANRMVLRTTTQGNGVVTNNKKTILNESLVNTGFDIVKAYLPYCITGVLLSNAFSAFYGLSRPPQMWKLCVSLLFWSTGELYMKDRTKSEVNKVIHSKKFGSAAMKFLESKACLVNAALFSFLSLVFSLFAADERYWLAAGVRIPLLTVANVIFWKRGWNILNKNSNCSSMFQGKLGGNASFACLLLSYL